MSLDANFIPTLDDNEAVAKIANEINAEVNTDDLKSMFEFAVKYQSWFRYKFADAMLEARNN